MSDLQRRYERLLRLYPAAYRRARGAEMLAVLMDSTPQDRQRPPWRQVQGLILGALRVRAGAQGRRTAGQAWRVSLRTAALILLIQTAGDTLWPIMFQPSGESLHTAQVVQSLTVTAVCALAILAILRGTHLVATAMTAMAFALEMLDPQLVRHFLTPPITPLPPSWELLLVTVLLIPLIGRGQVATPKTLQLLLLVPVVSVALDAYGTLTLDPSFQTGSRAAWQTLAVITILWSVIDERVALTCGLAFLYVVVNHATADLSGGWEWTLHSWSSWWRWKLLDMGILAILPVLNIAVGATIAARGARV